MKNKHEYLEKAIRIAADAHRGQADKAGMPYILHPIRIMTAMRTPEEMAVAVLHDVVEDTEVTLDDLRAAGIPDAVVAAVDCLTKRDGEAYGDYLARVEGNVLARTVKLGDLADNMRLERLETITEKDLKRLEKYHGAMRRLGRSPA